MGPLAGLRVVEFAGIGPVPFAAMLLAELGADVLRVDRPGGGGGVPNTYLRGRPSVAIDLKSAEGVEVALRLVDRAEVVLEGYRPGVMERNGLGPDLCLRRNPDLVYARMTGWGQHGPLARVAGHDINYIALSGALDQFRRAGERPVAPLNLLGDFGGGALYLATGVLAAVLHARSGGGGQVLDVAMIDGVASLLTMVWGRMASGDWDAEPGTNMLDTGAHYYEVYETADGRFVAVGAIEPQFYAELLQRLELDPADLPPQSDRDHWPAMKDHFAAVFRQRTRDEWAAVFDGSDACVTPVLSMVEAPSHPQLAARGTYVVADGVTQPAPAPRFSRTPPELGAAPRPAGADTATALAAWGFAPEELATLLAAGAIAGPRTVDPPGAP